MFVKNTLFYGKALTLCRSFQMKFPLQIQEKKKNDKNNSASSKEKKSLSVPLAITAAD